MERVRGVVTADTDRELDELLNRHRHPEVLLALCIAESGGVRDDGTAILNEHAWRDTGGCDVSAGLAQQSMCWLAEKVPGATTRPGVRPSAAAIAVIRDWYWDAAHALADAGPRIDALMDRWGNPLEALSRWNKPNLPSGQNPNTPNYRRGLAAAEHYRVKEAPMPDPTTEPQPATSLEEVAKRQVDIEIRDALTTAALEHTLRGDFAVAEGFVKALQGGELNPHTQEWRAVAFPK